MEQLEEAALHYIKVLPRLTRAQRSLPRSFSGRPPGDSLQPTPSPSSPGSPLAYPPCLQLCSLDYHHPTSGHQTSTNTGKARIQFLTVGPLHWQGALAGKPGLLDHELVWLLCGPLEQVCATSYLQTPHLRNLCSGLQPAEVFESRRCHLNPQWFLSLRVLCCDSTGRCELDGDVLNLIS